MLEEAIDLIRLLWEGKWHSFRGLYYTVENARIYTLPHELPPIMVAAGGPKAADLAGRVGDGLVATAADPEVVKRFAAAGGIDKPRYGQLHVCWAENEARARRIAYEVWPIAGIKAPLLWELPLPAYFEEAAKMIREEDVARDLVCGPDPEKHMDAIKKYIDAGFDHVYIHQIGPDQEGFFRFYESEVLPKLREVPAATPR